MSDSDDISRHNVPGFMEDDTHIVDADHDSVHGDDAEVVDMEDVPDTDNHGDEDYAVSDDESEPEDLAGMHDNSNRKLQSEVQRLQEELAKANEENEKKDGKLVKLEWSKGELARDTEQLNEQVKALKRELATKEFDFLSAKDSDNPLQDRVHHLSQELSEEREGNEEKAGRIAKLESDLELAEATFAKDTDRMAKAIEDLEKALAEEQHNVKNCRAEIKDIQRQKSDLEKDLKEAEEQRASDAAENQLLRAQLKSCNEKSKDMRQHKGEMDKAMNATVDDFEKRLARANSDKDEYKRKYESAQDELKEIANALNDCENAYRQKEKQLSRSNHLLQQVRHEAMDTQTDSDFDGDDSRAPSRNDDLPQSTRLDAELENVLESETEGFYFIQDQSSDHKTDASQGDNADSSLNPNKSRFPGHGRNMIHDGSMSDSEDEWMGASDNEDDGFVELSPGVGIDLNGESAIQELVDDEAPVSDRNKLESDADYEEDAKSIYESALLVNSTSEHEKTPVDHPRQPSGIPSNSRHLWTDKYVPTHTASYAMTQFDHSAYQKRETFEQGTQTEDMPRNLEPGSSEENHKRLISTLHPLLYLLYMLIILLGSMINRLISLEVTLRKQFDLPTDVEYVKARPRGQIHGAMATSPSQQDDTAQHRPEEPMTTSVQKAEGHLRRLVQYILLCSCVLGVLMVRLVYVWWSDDQWQWTTANRTPRCIPIEMLRGHGNEHDWVQVWNFQVVKILNDRVAHGG
ncbi:uncharacterized protein ACHE_21285A [Aspergillus chevalieri]|uniref:Uncharacterized protein n=1 Tax=Aspergillus chevalieri TaxID=182096 RepID=A0A7R7VJF5_ASPCH|nr:uncharacterized protein ACHE_21285A [Aspergillus chevalieri]BCR85827.1 hypothetical protein ACHE_21285A [Aspergillus chevalieri]